MADKYVPINGQVYSTNIDGKAVAASRVYDDANEQFLNETIAEIKDKEEEFGPYQSVAAAHSALAAKGLNKVGTTVGIVSQSNMVVEYWYQGGTAQVNLVEKQNGGTVDAYTKAQSDERYQQKESGKGLSTNDYTNEDKQKVTNAITDVSGKADKSEMSVTPGSGADADKTTIQLKQGTSARVLTQHQDISGKQDIIQDLSTIRSGAAAGATAQQPATTLAGYGITDGATKTEFQELESEVDSKLEEQDSAIALLDGHGVVITDDHTIVASPDTQKIYREPYHTEQIDGQGTATSLIGSDYYSYLPIVLENDTVYVGLNNCIFINLQNITIIGNTLTTTIPSGDEQYAVAKQVDGASDVADLSYTKTNDDVTPTKYTDWMCTQTSPSVVWKKIATYDFPGIDKNVTPLSSNLVESGAVFEGIIEYSRLNNVQLDLNTLQKRNGFIKIDGTFVARGTYTLYTIPVDGYKYIKVKSKAFTDELAISFLDDNDTLIVSANVVGKQTFVPGTEPEFDDYFAAVPTNASKIQVSTKTDALTEIQVFELAGKEIEEIESAIVQIENDIEELKDANYKTVATIDDAYAIHNHRIRISDNQTISSQAARMFYFHIEDGYKFIKATFNNDLTGYYAVLFIDSNGNIMSSPYAEALVGEHTYKLDIPDGAIQVAVGVPSTDVQPANPEVNIYAEKGNDSDVEELKSDVADIKEDVSTLQSDVSSIESNISTMQDEIDELKEQEYEVIGTVSDSYLTQNTRCKVSDRSYVSSQYARSYYFRKADFEGCEKVIAKFNNDLVGYLAIFFLDNNGDILDTPYSEALVGEQEYECEIPQNCRTIVVSTPDTDVQPTVPNVKILAKRSGDDGEYVENTPIKLKDFFGHNETYKGYIRHSEGTITSSSGSTTYRFKNQGFSKIVVKALNTHPTAPDGTPASFNVISFYTVDQWCGGQGYMIDESVTAIYNSTLKEYEAAIPEGCGIIMVTFNNPMSSGESIACYRGTNRVIIDNLKSLTDVRLELPAYCSEEYMRSKKEAIESRIKANASNSDLFIFMTDEHWERGSGNSMSMVKWLYDNLNIPRLFSGGDTGHEGLNMDFIKIREKAFGGKIYQVCGNHEYLSYTFDSNGNTTEDEVFYGLYMKQNNDVVYGDRNRHYYYVDNNVQKIRYIVLNAFAQGDGSANSATIGFEQTQLNWFQNVALATESGWSIIIFTHRLYEGSPSNTANTYIPPTCRPVADIIENYEGNGKIIAVFQGHTHYDMIKYLKNNTIPVIITTSDHHGSYRWSEADNAYIRDYDVTRETGTITEHAFDVVTVNKTLKQISCVRIGCPAKDGNGQVEERIINWV